MTTGAQMFRGLSIEGEVALSEMKSKNTRTNDVLGMKGKDWQWRGDKKCNRH